MSEHEDNLQERIALIKHATDYLSSRWNEINDTLCEPNVAPSIREALQKEREEMRKSVEQLSRDLGT